MTARPFRLLLALLLLGSAPPPASPASAAEVAPRLVLSADSADRWVAFTVTPGNQIAFPVLLDGMPLTAILDTGVSYTVLSRKVVDARRLPVVDGPTATAIGGNVAIGWAATRSLALGGLTRFGGRVAVAPLPAIATGGAQAVDLLIGRDLIGGYALDLDFANHRLRLLPSGRMPFAGASAPLTIVPDRLVYATELTLGDRRLRPMLLDTGDGAAVTVTDAAWRSGGQAALPTTTALAYGLAGPLVTTLAIVPSLAIGALQARDVEVRVEPAGGFSDAIGAAGRIGTGFLQHYRVLLDPGAGHIVFSPGPDADRPPLRSTSGLLLGILRDRLRVLHVMRGGPAARAGDWHDGDEICAVDATPIDRGYPTSPLARWSVGQPGRAVALTMCDGTTRRLTLATFY